MDNTEKIKQLKKEFEEYASSQGFRLNPNEKAVEGIILGLLRNEEKHGQKYCPCRRLTGLVEEDSQKICPCVWHKEEIAKDGHCQCNLYFK